MNRVTRRYFAIATVATAVSARLAMNRMSASAEAVEIPRAPLPQGSTSTPVADTLLFTGDVESLWDEPWIIGTDEIEINGIIVQRFVGTEKDGFALGLDGLVFRSVIYAQHKNQRMFFVGADTDLSDLRDARTFTVRGNYGGVQHNTDSGWEDPIVVAREIKGPR